MKTTSGTREHKKPNSDDKPPRIEGHLQQILTSENRAFALNDLRHIESPAYRAILQGLSRHEVYRHEIETKALHGTEEFRNALAGLDLVRCSRILESIDFTNLTPIERNEWMLEHARLAVHIGEFESSHAICDELLQDCPHPPTRISALIVKAHSGFELGQFHASLADVREAEGLCRVFPGYPGQAYLFTLKAKLLGRTESPAVGLRSLNDYFAKSAAIATHLPDLVHVYLRSLVDLYMLNRTPSLVLAEAACRVAEHLGDELYFAMDRVIRNALRGQGTDAQFQELIKDVSGIPRALRLLQESLADTPRTETARLTKETRGLAALEQQVFVMASPVIVNVSFGWILEMDPITMRSLKLSDGARVLLKTLSSQMKCSKEAVFNELWPEREYNKLENDSLMRNLLSRTKRETGISIRNRDGFLSLPEGVVVLS